MQLQFIHNRYNRNNTIICGNNMCYIIFSLYNFLYFQFYTLLPTLFVCFKCFIFGDKCINTRFRTVTVRIRKWSALENRYFFFQVSFEILSFLIKVVVVLLLDQLFVACLQRASIMLFRCVVQFIMIRVCVSSINRSK